MVNLSVAATTLSSSHQKTPSIKSSNVTAIVCVIVPSTTHMPCMQSTEFFFACSYSHTCYTCGCHRHRYCTTVNLNLYGNTFERSSGNTFERIERLYKKGAKKKEPVQVSHPSSAPALLLHLEHRPLIRTQRRRAVWAYESAWSMNTTTGSGYTELL